MANAESSNATFESATDFVRDNSGLFDSDTLLKLYARYKQVKEGVCNTSKPGFFDLQGKQKWSAWKKLGDMSKKCAMKEYIDILSAHNPDWLSQVSKSQDKPSSGKQMSLGVAVSTMVNPDVIIDDELKTVFDWCKDGNTKHVARLLTDNSTIIDEKDSEGMVLLHWACDRGDTQMVNLLLKNGASVNIQLTQLKPEDDPLNVADDISTELVKLKDELDSDGQTGLHFAVICEHPEVVRLLLENGASVVIPDTEGQTVQNLVADSTPEIKQIFSGFPVR